MCIHKSDVSKKYNNFKATCVEQPAKILHAVLDNIKDKIGRREQLLMGGILAKTHDWEMICKREAKLPSSVSMRAYVFRVWTTECGQIVD